LTELNVVAGFQRPLAHQPVVHKRAVAGTQVHHPVVVPLAAELGVPARNFGIVKAYGIGRVPAESNDIGR